MSFQNGFLCPLQDTAACPAAAAGARAARRPACDYAEAELWKTWDGQWQCLFGCYCQCGLSIEWHDFTCAEPRDWAASFHPDSLELCLNLSGHARMTLDEHSAFLGPMTAGLYFAGSRGLAAWRLPGERHQFLTLEYSRTFLKRHLCGAEPGLDPVVRHALRSPRGGRHLFSVFPLTRPLRRMIDMLRQPPVHGANLWFQGKALELMAEIFFRSSPEPAHPRRQQVARQRIERAIQALSQSLAEPPSLEELGRKIGCSPYHLSRTFSREMGMTIPQYLRQMRMERAAELLRSGKFNVTEAALEVGYSSLSHFSHAFRQTMGCCPGLYPLGELRAFGPLPPHPPPVQPSAKNPQSPDSPSAAGPLPCGHEL